MNANYINCERVCIAIKAFAVTPTSTYIFFEIFKNNKS